MSEHARAKARRISQKEAIQLARWFEENKERFTRLGLTATEVAQEASTLLGHAVAASSVRELFNEQEDAAVHHVWPRQAKEPKHQEELRQLRAQCKVLALAVQHLYKELGAGFPNGLLGPEVTAIAEGRCN